MPHANETPAETVARVERGSRRIETPCGAGSMVWRLWGSGAPLLMLHGGYGSWTHWLRNVEALAETYTVIAPDLPGLGDSAMPPPPVSAESLAEIVAAGIDIVVPPPTPLSLVGFSFGSILGGHVAARADTRIARFLLVGPSGLAQPRPPMTDLRRVEPGMSVAETRALQRDNLAKLMFYDARRIDDLAIHLQVENVGRSRVRSRLIARGDTLARVLPRVKARLGVIWGAHDATMMPFIEEKAAFFRDLQPDVPVTLLPDAGHWAQWEAAPLFNERLQIFLKTGR